MPSTAGNSSEIEAELEINIPAKTLIVLHGNRYVEVFASDQHACKILQVPFMESAAGEILTEQLILERLPHSWKETYAECNLADRDSIRDISVVDLMQQHFDLSVVQTLNRHLPPTVFYADGVRYVMVK